MEVMCKVQPCQRLYNSETHRACEDQKLPSAKMLNCHWLKEGHVTDNRNVLTASM